MIDLHMHVVPCIDDGPYSIETAVEMIRSSKDQGVTDIFCISHSWGNYEAYNEAFIAIKKHVEECGIDVTLHHGCEIMCTPSDVRKIVADIDAGHYHTLGNSDYVLLEFDRYISKESLVKTIRKFIDLRNNHIVIAHVERLQCLHEDKSAIEELRTLGCLFQLNAYSLTEEDNEEIRLFARRMIEQQKISFLGSDAHRMEHRPPNVASGIQYIYENAPVEYADAICYKNAKIFL